MTTAKERAHPLAAKVAREVRMVPTGANIETAHRAIVHEAKLSHIPATKVVEMLILAARECDPLAIHRFWFEDARWRSTNAYQEFRERHREQTAC